MEIVMLIWGILFFLLGVMSIFKDEIKALIREPRPQQTEEEKKQKQEHKEQFNKMMNYSYEQAITKRGDN